MPSEQDEPVVEADAFVEDPGLEAGAELQPRAPRETAAQFWLPAVAVMVATMESTSATMPALRAPNLPSEPGPTEASMPTDVVSSPVDGDRGGPAGELGDRTGEHVPVADDLGWIRSDRVDAEPALALDSVGLTLGGDRIQAAEDKKCKQSGQYRDLNELHEIRIRLYNLTCRNG